MIDLAGHWHPEHSAEQLDAVLRLDEHTYQLQAQGQDLTGPQARLGFSQRIGNIPRRITFPNGSVFVCGNNEAIDGWLKQVKHTDGRFHILHRLESQWRWVVLSVLVVMLVSGGFIWKVIPWMSEGIARSMPVEIYQKLGTGTLAGLDKVFLGESELPAEVRQRISQRFERILDNIDQDEYRFELHFRTMVNPKTKKSLANAFALPSGDIVVTDALVNLADHDEEIDSVLMHEIAHVVQRHGLQQIIHSSALTVIITLLLGDASALPTIVIALPTFLLESSYSRQHETEADDFALEKMVEAGIDPKHFAEMMQKFLELEVEAGYTSKNSSAEEDNINSYLSSHPATQIRIDRALNYSKIAPGG